MKAVFHLVTLSQFTFDFKGNNNTELFFDKDFYRCEISNPHIENLNGAGIDTTGFTDFEDDREYKIEGKDTNGMFVATGMDGLIEMDENIVPLNYWNKEMLKEKRVFDTQKGIVRDIDVKKLKNENIKINGSKFDTEKFIFNASVNPKDLGPFPEYTLWYNKDELIKMEFQNPKDKKTITIIRTDLINQ